MSYPVIDAHIHLDLYEKAEQELIIENLAKDHIDSLITVSNHLNSARANLALANLSLNIKPAFGYHPEQQLPTDSELMALEAFIDLHKETMIAIGEVGLPYYLSKDNPQLPYEPYIELLEYFMRLASELDKPIILHAVYEDALIVCDLLEKYSINKAHFHWFKGEQIMVDRLIANGYYISITPDVLYEKEIITLVKQYPLEQLMVETDGPWPFAGPFKNQLTQPKMIHHSIKQIALIKKMPLKEIYQQLYANTKQFYHLN